MFNKNTKKRERERKIQRARARSSLWPGEEAEGEIRRPKDSCIYVNEYRDL